MPQATMTFTMPEEREEFEAAIYGEAWKSVVRDFDEWLREQVKYYDQPVGGIRERLRQLIDERGLQLD